MLVPSSFSPRMALLLSALVCLGGIEPAKGDIIGFSTGELNLTSPRIAKEKAEWSDPEWIQVHEDGLGWGTEADEGSRDFWLQTRQPIAIGESWRPAIAANLRVTVAHVGTPGILYVRYSPDAKHWSEWQVLRTAAPPKDVIGQHFVGNVRVPYRVREQYNALLEKYGDRDDVAWASDEEAFVQELVARDPEFFRRQLPFVGYVQFLYETQLRGGERIKGMNAEVHWGIGGLHMSPKNPDAYKDHLGPWRFKGD